jgi:hypothetical protein
MPTSEWAKVISASVVPVVIISACGLMCLAFYNRLAAIVSRLRAFQRERLEAQEEADRVAPGMPNANAGEAARLDLLLQHLSLQTSRVMRRARLIRLTLSFLLLAIALLIMCSLLLGLSVELPRATLAAGVLFAAGLLSMLISVTLALLELQGALEPAELESKFVSDMINHRTPRSGDSASPM